MSEKDIPGNGARVRFDLLESGDVEARYQLQLLVDGNVHAGEATIGEGGREISIGAISPEPPEWLETAIKAFARQIGTSRSREGGRWPRRVTRWRAPRA